MLVANEMHYQSPAIALFHLVRFISCMTIFPIVIQAVRVADSLEDDQMQERLLNRCVDAWASIAYWMPFVR